MNYNESLESEVSQKKIRKYPFSFSEIEAKEACDWLRAAGFPQYAQLYEGRLSLQADHPLAIFEP